MMNRRLYLVKHKTDDIFKIGIATDDSRFYKLHDDYDINWDESIYFEGENNDIIKMEKILHKGFYKHNVIMEGTGGTEWFQNSCMIKVVDAILHQTKLFDFNINFSYKTINLNKKKVKPKKLSVTPNKIHTSILNKLGYHYNSPSFSNFLKSSLFEDFKSILVYKLGINTENTTEIIYTYLKIKRTYENNGMIYRMRHCDEIPNLLQKYCNKNFSDNKLKDIQNMIEGMYHERENYNYIKSVNLPKIWLF